MKRDNINYLVVGTFVLGLFAVLMLFLYQLTGGTGPSDTYTVTYNNVAGIKFGTPVLYEGYQVGQVESITPVSSEQGMKYRLVLSVTQGWNIPADSVAKIVASGLLASMTIEIQEGDSDKMLEPGSQIEGQEAIDMLTVVNDVAANFRQLSHDSIRPLLKTLNSSIDEVSSELLQLTREDIRPLFNSLGQKVEKADFVEQTNQLVMKLDKIADDLRDVLNEDNRKKMVTTLDNVEQASGNLNVLLNNFERTRSNMDQVLASMDKLVSNNKQDLRASVHELRTALETIADNIDAITYHLEGTSRNMHEFSRYLRANPSALIRGKPKPDNSEATQESQ